MAPIIFYKDRAMRGRGVGLPSGALLGRDSSVTFVEDSFTDTNGVLLQNHTGELGATWAAHPLVAGDLTIQANRVWGSGTRLYYASGVPPSADYDVIGTIRCVTDNNASQVAIAGRLSSSVVTGYFIRYTSSGDSWSLEKIVAGSGTNLGTGSGAITAGQEAVVTLSMRGSLIRAYVNGSLLIEATDNSITAAGRAGIRVLGSGASTGGIHLGDIEAVTA